MCLPSGSGRLRIIFQGLLATSTSRNAWGLKRLPTVAQADGFGRQNLQNEPLHGDAGIHHNRGHRSRSSRIDSVLSPKCRPVAVGCSRNASMAAHTRARSVRSKCGSTGVQGSPRGVRSPEVCHSPKSVVRARDRPNAEAHLPGPPGCLHVTKSRHVGRVRCSTWFGGRLGTILRFMLTTLDRRPAQCRVGKPNSLGRAPRAPTPDSEDNSCGFPLFVRLVSPSAGTIKVFSSSNARTPGTHPPFEEHVLARDLRRGLRALRQALCTSPRGCRFPSTD